MKNSVLFSATPVSGSGTPSGSATPAAGVTDDLVRRVAEAKRRVADAQSKLAVKDNPYMVCFLFPLSSGFLPKIVSDLDRCVDHASNWQEEGYACRTDSARRWLEDGSPSSSS